MTMPKFEPVAYVDEDDDNKWATIIDDLDIKLNAPLYAFDQLTEAYEAGKREQADQLEAARAEIERLKTVPMKYRRMAFNAHLQDENAKLSKQLADEQAKNVGLREALINLMKYNPRTRYVGGVEFGYEEPVGECLLKVLDRCDNALATPSDTSALEALVAKAGEKMREMCIAEFLTRTHWYAEKGMRALPAVTLEDLK